MAGNSTQNSSAGASKPLRRAALAAKERKSIWSKVYMVSLRDVYGGRSWSGRGGVCGGEIVDPSLSLPAPAATAVELAGAS